MFHVPRFYHDTSLKLARVLEEIGVNERIILKRRRAILLRETLDNITKRANGLNASHLYFGSQSEGTTTPGLVSDTDFFFCDHKFSVIKDWTEWEPRLGNLLFIQEETTPPGYCMLQVLHTHEPTAMTVIHDEDYVRYSGDKILLKNTFTDFRKMLPFFGIVRNGPADTFNIGFYSLDCVYAFPFKTLPEFLNTWLQQQTQKGRLSHDMKRYIESNPCCVVPVGRKGSTFQEAEWRISTSHAERCLMFNLNITQLQCYVLLKILLKTHLKHPHEKALSSFMCKNILLQSIGKIHPSKWCPQNLLSVFEFVILQLKRSILQETCPHFIVHENNLLAHKFTPEVKRWLLEKIQFIYETRGLAFLDIEIDEIGNRLQTQLNTPIHCIIVRDIEHDQARHISGGLLYSLARRLSLAHTFHLMIMSGMNSLNSIITKSMLPFLQLNRQGSCLEQVASRLLTPLLCSSLGSVIASRDIYNNHSVSPEALTWLSLGLNSDVASSRLKLASVYYGVGDFHTTETILSNIAVMYDQGLVEAVCGCCSDQGGSSVSLRFLDYSDTHNELSLKHIVLCKIYPRRSQLSASRATV